MAQHRSLCINSSYQLHFPLLLFPFSPISSAAFFFMIFTAAFLLLGVYCCFLLGFHCWFLFSLLWPPPSFLPVLEKLSFCFFLNNAYCYQFTWVWSICKPYFSFFWKKLTCRKQSLIIKFRCIRQPIIQPKHINQQNYPVQTHQATNYPAQTHQATNYLNQTY